MYFSQVTFVTLAVALSGVVATPMESRGNSPYGNYNLNSGNKYNAPQPPWQDGQPGWYYGNNPGQNSHYPSLGPQFCSRVGSYSGWINCPSKSPSNGYHGKFEGLSGATQASDYLTYGLVDTIAECKQMCNSVAGCKFINTYHDVNGKNGSPDLTCALFSKCHTSSDADNRGGQTQPDGSIDYITDSNGYCKY